MGEFFLPSSTSTVSNTSRLSYIKWKFTPCGPSLIICFISCSFSTLFLLVLYFYLVYILFSSLFLFPPYVPSSPFFHFFLSYLFLLYFFHLFFSLCVSYSLLPLQKNSYSFLLPAITGVMSAATTLILWTDFNHSCSFLSLSFCMCVFFSCVHLYAWHRRRTPLLSINLS